MYQKNHRQEDEELNYEGDLPVVPAAGDDDGDDSSEDEAVATPRTAAAPSQRASKAAAARAKNRMQQRTTRKTDLKNPLRTRSAAAIRAEREARQKPRSITQAADSEPKRTGGYSAHIDHSTVSSILRHPTRVVTEADLRAEYSYVLTDLRVTGLLAGGLLIVLVILALVLPK